jgi:phosphatidylserine/phosphatidylglycerophosphate/cardiolipin synthase-like enzyme
VQISRTVRRGFYADDSAPPGGRRFPVSGGEHGIMHQYVAAIDAAREAVYFENQLFGQRDILARVEAALTRGVRVVAVVPGTPSELVTMLRRAPEGAPIFQALAALGQREGFTLAGLTASRGGGVYEDIYVHTKVAIVDDVWATIGSTNLANRSFFGDTELNASFWHPETARSFRNELLSAHHGADLSALSFADALDAFATRAVENAARRAAGQPLHGFAFALDAATWGDAG